MVNVPAADTLLECRLCSSVGPHELDIWNGNVDDGEHPLNVKIFECIGIQVHADDETTKICRNCFNMINEYFPFRMACSARNVNYLLQKIKKATTPAPIECVSLTDSEGESSDDDGDNGDGVNDIAQNAVGVAVDANK